MVGPLFRPLSYCEGRLGTHPQAFLLQTTSQGRQLQQTNNADKLDPVFLRRTFEVAEFLGGVAERALVWLQQPLRSVFLASHGLSPSGFTAGPMGAAGGPVAADYPKQYPQGATPPSGLENKP